MLIMLSCVDACIWLSLLVLNIVDQITLSSPETEVVFPDNWILAALPPRQVYYSSYGPNLALAYSATVLGYVGWYVGKFIMITKREYIKAQYSTTFDRGTKLLFARTVLSSWDVSIFDKESLNEQKFVALQNARMLINEVQWKDRVKSRPPVEARALAFRRVTVLSIHGVLQTGIWFLIVYSQISLDLSFATEMFGTFVGSLAPVIVYSVLIELMPLLCPLLANQCRWDNPRSTRTHMVYGYFFGRVIGLVVLGLSE